MLLKNQNSSLPLNLAKVFNVAVIGPNAAVSDRSGLSQSLATWLIRGSLLFVQATDTLLGNYYGLHALTPRACSSSDRIAVSRYAGIPPYIISAQAGQSWLPYLSV